MIGTILIVILVLILLGAIPVWPHSKDWGYYPTGGLGLVLAILIVLMLMGASEAHEHTLNVNR